MNFTDCHSMNSQNDKIFAQQLVAWVWEIGVVYDFEEICSRAENLFSHCNNTLESYFNESKSTALLFAARKAQKILKGLEEDNLRDSVEDLLKLTVLLLKDDKFYLDRQFISNLIVLHMSAVLFGDLHKEVLVTTSKTTHYMKSQIISGENTYSSSESSRSLIEKLRKNFQQWVKQVRIPALCGICGNKELEKLPNPQYKIIFKYISNHKINISSLHSILDELETNSNLCSPSKSPPLMDIDSDSDITSERSKVLVNESSDAAIKMKPIEKNNKCDCKSKDNKVQKRFCNKNLQKFSNYKNRKKKKSHYDIIMLKGTIWEINKDPSSDEEFFTDDNDVEVRNVINIRKQTVNWDTDKTTSGFDKVYEIRTVSEEGEFGGSASFCVLDQMKKDLISLDKLIVKTRLLLAELEEKSLLLNEKCEQIKKNNNKESNKLEYSFGVKRKKGFQELSPANTSASKKNKIIPTLAEGDVENVSASCKTSTSISSTITTTTPTNNNKNSTCESSSSCSMPNLTPYKDVGSHSNIESFEKTWKLKKCLPANCSSSYSSDLSMPDLTPQNNSASCEVSRKEGLNSDFSSKGSPYVSLTPLRQSVLDRLNPFLETSNSPRKDNVNEEVNSLTKIDLVVTNSHLSPESNAVILELNDSSPPGLVKRKREESNLEDSPQVKKRLRIKDVPSTSDEETFKSSENIEKKVIDGLNKNIHDNEESFENAISDLSSSDSSQSLVEVRNKNASTFSLNNSLKKTGVKGIYNKTSDFEDLTFTEESITKKKLKSNSNKTKTNLLSSSRNKSSKSHTEISSSSDEFEVEKANYTKTLQSPSSVGPKSQKVNNHLPNARSTPKKNESFFTSSDCSDSSTSAENGKTRKRGRPRKRKNCKNLSHKSRNKILSPEFSATGKFTSTKTSRLKHLNSLVVSTSESSESNANILSDSKLSTKKCKKSTSNAYHLNKSFKSLVVSSSSESEDANLNARQCQKRTSESDESNKSLKTVHHTFPVMLKNCYVKLLFDKSLSNGRNGKIYT
ncbi:hypothetical protein Avbf_05930 [Armadillidium vulgare]|nr:hypothetical protein Avbf_05930 [Armadillidium vulgare]